LVTLEGEGIRGVSFAFDRHFRWYPRELPRPDYGIDLFVEGSTDDRPNGKFLAVQVKAGPSYFSETTAEGIVFRDSRHRDYWLGYAMPVLVALYDPDTQISYWQVVTPATFTSTGAGWKMLVPWAQRIDGDSVAVIDALLRKRETRSSTSKGLDSLRADRAWMELIDEGSRVLLEVEEWINKRSGRGTLRLVAEEEDSTSGIRERHFYAPGWDYKDLLPALVPWAELAIDEDFYGEIDRGQWDLETGAWDSEEGGYVVHSVDFDEWRANHVESGIRPYEDNGEVARWQLELRLNDLGESFLVVDHYLDEADRAQGEDEA
jgi:hypothetical protein